MDVIATVNISNGEFEEWMIFFKSYEHLRHKYVKNEIITPISRSKAEVSFTITDLDGLTELSSSQLLREGEDRLGVSVEVREKPHNPLT